MNHEPKTINPKLHCSPVDCRLQVLVQGQIFTVRAKGKSAFLVLREGQASVQVLTTQYFTIPGQVPLMFL